MKPSIRLPRRTRDRALLAAAAVAVVAGVVAALTLPSSPSGIVAANVSRNLRACLVTDASNAADGTVTAAAWAGLERAATTGRVNAERLPVPSTDATADLPYFNGAVQAHCALILSVGPALTAALDQAAKKNAHQRFYLVTTTPPPGPAQANVTDLLVAASPATTADQVYAAVMQQLP